ncbi:hypothetical protein FQN57_003239 [Myotisia sp. PD_48]|nr:hypothetical protein FQN57_003239 [Myotisia sp. PD_48]
MAPIYTHLFGRMSHGGHPLEEFSKQLSHPSNVFAILLMLGGDMVEKAYAQLVGTYVAPVAFSFGCVSHAVSAVNSTVGENRLMPQADFPCQVINGKTGEAYKNSSWVLGRMVRDYDHWMEKDVRLRLDSMLNVKWEEMKAEVKTSGETVSILKPRKIGLCVSVYRATDERLRSPTRDAVYKSGLLTTLIQLALAAAPGGKDGDWEIFLLTVSGIILSFLTGSLKQWRKEKWSTHDRSDKTVILTKGRGSQHAIVVMGDGRGLDLELLATEPQNPDVTCGFLTRLAIFILAVLWLVLVIIAAGVKKNTWYLLSVGGIGTLQNAYAVGKKRSPESFGIPLEFENIIGEVDVMDTLLAVEENYPSVGRNMLATFFPNGQLTQSEEQRWAKYTDAVIQQPERPQRRLSV